MISMTIEEIAKAITSEMKNIDSQSKVSGKVMIDSKKVKPGDLFVALKGEKVDGHNFCQEAISKGAVAVVVSQAIKDLPCLVVTEGNKESADVDQPTVIALGKLAKYLLSKLPNIWKIAVTGSSGKTTTKDLLSELGNLVGPTIYPIGSFNNEIGLPQTVLECDESTKVLILEMGARKQGNIRHLCEIAKPDTSIILNIGQAHFEIFTSVEKILQTKSEIIECLSKSDIAVLNHEDSTFSQQKTKAQIISFGLAGADVSAKNIILNDKAQAQFDLEFQGKSSPVKLQLVGAHQVSNSLAAAAVFLQRGFSVEKVAQVLSSIAPKSKWRMQVESNKANVTVINDSYNANPDSMKSAIRTLKQLGIGKKTVAILGEMRELGEISKSAHEEVAALVNKLLIDKVVIIGNGATPIFDYLTKNEYQGNLYFVENVEKAILQIKNFVEPNDVVLVKASRSIGLERVAQAILDDLGENLNITNNQEVGP